MTRIREIREAVGMSQGELARRMGVTQGAVSQWENGSTNPEITKLTQLAQILQTTVDELLQPEKAG